jgi:hypothetical protein
LLLGSILGAMLLGVAVLASRRRAGMTAAPVIAPGLADLRMREPAKTGKVSIVSRRAQMAGETRCKPLTPTRLTR